MDLEIIAPSAVKSDKDKYHMILLIFKIFKKSDTNELIYKTDMNTLL